MKNGVHDEAMDVSGDELSGNELSGYEPSDDETRRSRSPTVKRRKLPGRKHLLNDIGPCTLELGIVTWNVAHFGEGALEVKPWLHEVRRQSRAFAKTNVNAFAREFVDALRPYQKWEFNLRKLLPDVEADTAGQKKKLTQAEKRHRWTPKPTAKPDEAKQVDDAEEHEQLGEDDPERNDREVLSSRDDPFELATQLGGTWTLYDQWHADNRWAKHHQLLATWKAYFKAAFTAYKEAWSAFQFQWDDLFTETSESKLHGAILEEMEALVLTTKDLRLAAKMVVKPLLQLRERITSAQHLQNALEDHVKGPRRKDLDLAREALASADDAATWSFSHVFKCVVDLDRATHRVLVVEHIDLMLRMNPWLDAIVLQEVNKGIGELKKQLTLLGHQCIRGFRLVSRSGNKSQIEYYPLVLRGNSRLTVVSMEALHPDGRHKRTEHVNSSPTRSWNKTRNELRPILLYEVMVDIGDRVECARIGVVHTTPGGSEMSRKQVYDQVDIPLEVLAKSSIPVVVGGDYYLTEEAVTINWTELGTKANDRVKRDFRAPVEARLQEVENEITRLKAHLAKKPKPPVKRNQKRKAPGADAPRDDTGEEWQHQIEFLENERDALQARLDWLRRDKVQLIRNDREFSISVGNRIRDLKLELAQPKTGTNWKTSAILAWLDAQIADFFVYTGGQTGIESNQWHDARVGLVAPRGGLHATDYEEMLLAKYWRCASDHFPVGIVLSRDAPQAVERPFQKGDPAKLLLPFHQPAGPALPPREVLGFTNAGNTCYVNAALQLVWRMNASTQYQLRPPDNQLLWIRRQVEDILERRQQQGTAATYRASGPYRRFTTVSTEGLRGALAYHQAARGLGQQSDASEALLKMLEAYEQAERGFIVGRQDHLRDSLLDQSFGKKRPSSCHFMLRVETQYTLVDEPSAPEGRQGLSIDGKHLATTYSCTNLLVLQLPHASQRLPSEEGVVPADEFKDTMDVEDSQTESTASPLPMSFDALMNTTWHLAFGGQGHTADVITHDGLFAKARAVSETTHLAFAPDHWIIMLARFQPDGQNKNSAPVDVPSSFQGKALAGFIVHIGDRTNAGHYVACIEHQGTWYYIDDEQVKAVDGAAVKEASQDAYILYYA